MKTPRRQHVPEFRPVSRDDKVDEWAAAIAAGTRRHDGVVPDDAAAVAYADQFWRTMERHGTPIVEIMAIPASRAVDWALRSYPADLAAAPREEP